jgi:hypothetical protein
MTNKRLLLAVSCLCLLPLTSCKKTVSTDAYGLDSGADNISYVFKENVVDFNGSIQQASLEEVFLTGAWARVDEATATAKDTDVETLKMIGAVDIDGTETTLYYAKHIQIGDQIWTGALRGDEDQGYYRPGENVVYTLDSTTSEEADTTDLMRYLANTDAGVTYKLGERYQWYYQAVINDKVKILRTDTSTKNDDKYVGFDYTYKTDKITPTFPNQEKLRSKQTSESTWVSNVKAFNDYLATTRKKLNFVDRVADESLNKYYTVQLINDVWNYNPAFADNYSFPTDLKTDPNWEVITGCTATLKLVSIVAFFKGANYAFAKGEYPSVR